MRKKVVLLLPLTFNDGLPIPSDIRDSIFAQLYELSGGLTVVGKVHGTFRMENGAKQEDILEQVWLAVEENLLDELRELVSGFASVLQQERMYFEIIEASVELLSPTPERGSLS